MILIKNIGELVGIVPAGVLRKQGAEMAETGVLRDAWLAIEDGKINVWVRKNRQGEKDFGILMRPNDNYTDFKELCIIQNK